MSEDRHSYRGFWIGLAAGALAGLSVRRHLASPSHMPHLGVWQKALGGTRGPTAAAMLAGRIQARYEVLHRARPRFVQPVLRLHLDKIVLPGLALYRTLLDEGAEREEVLAEVESLFEVTFGRFSSVMSLLNPMPEAFTLFRWVTRRTLQLGFPPSGWEITAVQDDEHCIAFDYTRCFYLDVLTAYGAPELAPLYCKMDDLLYQSLPAAIVWHRTGTLAQGDERCDFRWCWEADSAR